MHPYHFSVFPLITSPIAICYSGNELLLGPFKYMNLADWDKGKQCVTKGESKWGKIEYSQHAGINSLNVDDGIYW